MNFLIVCKNYAYIVYIKYNRTYILEFMRIISITNSISYLYYENLAKNILKTETVGHSGVGGHDGAHAAHRRHTYDAYPGTDFACGLITSTSTKLALNFVCKMLT